MYIMSSANRDSLTASFLIHMPFISFSCLVALARTSSTMLNSSGDACGELFIYGLYYVEVVYFYSWFIECFYHKRILVLVKCFFCIEIIMYVLSLIMVMCCITFIDLCMLNHLCIQGINSTWSWCIILLMCCGIWFATILLRILASIFIRDVGLFFFLVMSLSGFDIKVILTS